MGVSKFLRVSSEIIPTNTKCSGGGNLKYTTNLGKYRESFDTSDYCDPFMNNSSTIYTSPICVAAERKELIE